MSSYLRPRRGKKSTAETQLTSSTPLKRGEVFFEVPDTGVGTGVGKIKMGDGVTGYSALPYFLDNSGSGGHTIENESGTDLTQRDTLQFAGYLKTTDDSTNHKTVVDNTPINVTWNEYNALSDAEREGNHYIITDAPGVDPTADTVSATADGVKTYSQLLDELFALIDKSKVTDRTGLAIQYSATSFDYWSIIEKTNNVIMFSFTYVTTKTSIATYALKANGSEFKESNNGTITDKSSNVPTNGVKIILYYNTSSQIVNLKTNADNCMMSDGVTSVEDVISTLKSGTVTLPYASQYYCIKDITVPSGAKVVANFIYGAGAYNKTSGVMVSNLTDTTARIIAFSSAGSFASGDSVDVNYICF